METQDFSFNIKSLGDSGLIEGVASAYGNVDLQGDIVAAGAFSKSIAAGSMPAMLLYHDLNRPVGRWDSFTETAQGLMAKGTLALGTPDADTAYKLLNTKALTGLSVGFTGAQRERGTGGARIIKSARLIEVSLVTVPANPEARIRRVKSIGGASDIEDLLRESGISGRKAKAAASAAWAAIDRSHDEDEAEARIKQLLTNTNTALERLIGA